MAFEHLKEKKEQEKPEQDSKYLSLKEDIETLKLKLLEDSDSEICQIDEQSISFLDLKEVEKIAHEQVMDYLISIKDDKGIEESKLKISACSDIMQLVERYRHLKLQMGLLTSLKFRKFVDR